MSQWKAILNNEKTLIEIRDGSDLIGIMSGIAPSDWTHAKLVAAAPDLMEAIKFVSENLDHEDECPTQEMNSCLRCALDKAINIAARTQDILP